jgi:phosphate transport system substrate-binding protein
MSLGLAALVGMSLSTSLANEPQALTLKGSNTFGEELGPALIRVYRAHYPGVQVELTTEGSGGGLRALLNQACDIAAASRTANEDELRTARARGIKLRSHFIGSYGIHVIVHPDNPIKNLSMTEIRDLFTGTITNWRDVGGPDAPVQCYIRDPASGTHLGFRELAMENQPYTATATAHHSYAEIAAAVAKDPHGIGYTGMQLEHPDQYHPVLVNGIPGNVMSVNEGLYPYARGLRLYTRQGDDTAAARAFIRFVRSDEGQAILEGLGNVPRVTQRLDTGGIAP